MAALCSRIILSNLLLMLTLTQLFPALLAAFESPVAFIVTPEEIVGKSLLQ